MAWRSPPESGGLDGGCARQRPHTQHLTISPFAEAKTDKNPGGRNVLIVAKKGTGGPKLAETMLFIRTVFIYSKDILGGYESAWKYAQWKYDAPRDKLDTVAFGPNIAEDRAQTALSTDDKRADCKLGRKAFSSENYCASTIGHENVHGNQKYTYFINHQTRGTDHAEVPAYQWEIDHANDTGINQQDIGIITGYRDYYKGDRPDRPND